MMRVLLFFIIISFIESKPPLRIIGGRDARDAEYPYVVRIELQLPITKHDNSKILNSLPVCTGSVISPKWTVSAAHCFHFLDTLRDYVTRNQSLRASSEDNLIFVIRHGSVNATPSEAEAFSRVDYYIKHPAFTILVINNSMNPRVHNDVALVHHQPISLKQYGKIAGIDFTSLTGHEVTVMGYGKTYDSHGELFDTLTLQKPLQVVAGVVVKCSRNSLMYPALCIAQQCGQATRKPCSGDSGGPVLHSAGIVAVITKARHCFEIPYDTLVYTTTFNTPLSPYMQWISDHVRNNR